MNQPITNCHGYYSSTRRLIGNFEFLTFMKKILLLLVLSMLFSCKDSLDRLTMFDMDFRETVAIQSSTGINLPFNVFTPDITTNSEASFANNNTRKDLIEDIRLKQLKMTITSPTSGDFSFLKSIALYMNAEALPEVLIGSKDNIPDNEGNILELDISDVNFKEYIKKDKISIRLSTVTDELITQDHQIEIYSLFRVDAKILGI